MPNNFPPVEFEPVPGNYGSILMGTPNPNANEPFVDTVVPAATWAFHMGVNGVYMPSGSSLPGCDIGQGIKKATIRATGVVRKTFNPFTPPLAAKLNKYVSIICRVWTSNAGELVQASTRFALVTEWHYADDADGNCVFAMTAEGGWRFTDFSNNVA